MTDDQKSTVNNFTVIVIIKVNDIYAISDQFSNLAVLDLSGVTISVTYNSLVRKVIYQANEMPVNLFYDGMKSNTSLKTIVFPQA